VINKNLSAEEKWDFREICVRMEKKRSWACNFVLQVSLFIAFYLALNLDQPQTSLYNSRKGTRTPLDVYFLSVRGGYRPLKQRALLLKQVNFSSFLR